jgi:hypothetical protein
MICTEFLRVVKEASRIFEATNKQGGMFITLNLGGSITTGNIISRKVYKQRTFGLLKDLSPKLEELSKGGANEVISALEDVHKVIDKGIDNDLGNKIYLLGATTFVGNFRFESATLVVSADAVQAWTLGDSNRDETNPNVVEQHLHSEDFVN